MLNNFVAQIHHILNHSLEILIDTFKLTVAWMGEVSFVRQRPFGIFEMPSNRRDDNKVCLSDEFKVISRLIGNNLLKESQDDFEQALNLLLKLDALFVEQTKKEDTFEKSGMLLVHTMDRFSLLQILDETKPGDLQYISRDVVLQTVNNCKSKLCKFSS